jgi:hypothetical protein
MAFKGNYRECKIIQFRQNYNLTNLRELSQTENKEFNFQKYVPNTVNKIAFIKKAIKTFSL